MGQCVGCALDHGGRVWWCGLDHGVGFGVWIKSWVRVWGFGLDHGGTV